MAIPFWLETFLFVTIESFGISIALFVFLSNKHSRVNQLFSLMFGFLFFYLASVYFFHRFHLLIFERMGYGFVTLFFIPAYYFCVVYFPKESKKRDFFFEFFLVTALLILSFLAFASGFIIKEVKVEGEKIEVIRGEGFHFYLLFIGFLVCFYLGSLTKKYFTLSVKERKKVFYFLLGAFLFGGTNLIFNIISLFFYEQNPYADIANYSLIFPLIFGTIAITRHHLFGLRFLFSEVIIALIGALLLINIVFSRFLWEYIFKFFLFLCFLFLSYFLTDSIIKEARQKEELEKLNQKLKEMAHSLEEKVKERTKELEEAKTVLEIKVKARTRELEELNKMLEEKVKERTRELQKKVEELEKFQKIAIGRELRISQLKKEIEALKKKLKEK